MTQLQSHFVTGYVWETDVVLSSERFHDSWAFRGLFLFFTTATDGAIYIVFFIWYFPQKTHLQVRFLNWRV